MLRRAGMSFDPSQPLRVAMLARVVFPLHGFGGIERHVFHLVTHLARLGARVTLYVQEPTTDHRPPTTGYRPKIDSPRSSILHPPSSTALASLPGAESVIFLRYDYTSPYLRPNAILGRQINYPWYSWRLGLAAAAAARRGAYDVVHAQGLCALGYGWVRRHDRLLAQLPFIANPHGLEEYRTPDW